MSTQQPGSPRRRRIAGERRPKVAPETASETTSEATPEAVAKPSAPAAPPPVRRDVPAAPAVVSGGLDDHVTELTEPTGPSETRASRLPVWWGSRVSVAVLAGALAVLVTLAVLLVLGLLGLRGIADLGEADDVAAAERTAPAVAERAAAAILAYDHRTLDADMDAAVRFMTPEFAAKYTDTFERVVKPTAEDTQATVTAEVQASSVVRAGEDRVRVLLFVDQATNSTANAQPQLALNRVEFIMVREGGSWLVEDISSY